MKLICKIFIVISIFCLLPTFASSSMRGLDGYEWQKIDARKNARLHSNMGNIYFEENNFIAALKEYEIAYKLTQNSNESATYLYNIGRCFLKLQKYKEAKNVLKGAINKDCINMTYYDAYTDACIKSKTYEYELKKAISDYENPYNRIIAGLIYYKIGKKSTAKAVFDEFINMYPKMIITEDVKSLLKKMN